MFPFLKKFSSYLMESSCCDPSVSSGLRVESAPTLKDMYADNYRSSEVSAQRVRYTLFAMESSSSIDFYIFHSLFIYILTKSYISSS